MTDEEFETLAAKWFSQWGPDDKALAIAEIRRLRRDVSGVAHATADGCYDIHRAEIRGRDDQIDDLLEHCAGFEAKVAMLEAQVANLRAELETPFRCARCGRDDLQLRHAVAHSKTCWSLTDEARALAEARSGAIEEAAQIAEEHEGGGPITRVAIAKAIRSLAEPKETKP